MKSRWTSAEHVGKIQVSILNILSGEFHKQTKKKELEKDWDLIIKLSQAAGYQTQLYTALQKSHDYAKRLERIEKEMPSVRSEDLAMEHNPVIKAETELKTADALR